MQKENNAQRQEIQELAPEHVVHQIPWSADQSRGLDVHWREHWYTCQVNGLRQASLPSKELQEKRPRLSKCS